MEEYSSNVRGWMRSEGTKAHWVFLGWCMARFFLWLMRINWPLLQYQIWHWCSFVTMFWLLYKPTAAAVAVVQKGSLVCWSPDERCLNSATDELTHQSTKVKVARQTRALFSVSDLKTSDGRTCGDLNLQIGNVKREFPIHLGGHCIEKQRLYYLSLYSSRVQASVSGRV